VPVKHEVKPPAMNFSETAHCSFGGDKLGSQPRHNVGADNVAAGPPRKWKHRHINRHFSTTSDHQGGETAHRAQVPDTTVKGYPSPSWLVAEHPMPLSSVCHQGLPVVKKGSPCPPNDLTKRFMADSMEVSRAPAPDSERNAMLRKRRLDDRVDAMPFAMSPNVTKFPTFNYGITPVNIATGYLHRFERLRSVPY